MSALHNASERFVYLDIGEIFLADGDGAPAGDIPVCSFSSLEDEIGPIFAAAPDLLEELEQQADGTSTIITLLAGQPGPVAASLRGMLSIQEQAARAAIQKARGQ